MWLMDPQAQFSSLYDTICREKIGSDLLTQNTTGMKQP
jgi:hypothetical protein